MLPRGWVKPRASWRRWASHTPPVWMPTRAVSRVTTGRMDSASAWHRASASSLGSVGMAVGVQEGLQDELGGHRIHARLAVLPVALAGFPQAVVGLSRAETPVHTDDGQGVAAMELVGEAFAAGREGMGLTLQAAGDTHHQGHRPPLGDELGDGAKAAVVSGLRQGGEGTGPAGFQFAAGDADARQAEIETQQG